MQADKKSEAFPSVRRIVISPPSRSEMAISERYTKRVSAFSDVATSKTLKESSPALPPRELHHRLGRRLLDPYGSGWEHKSQNHGQSLHLAAGAGQTAGPRMAGVQRFRK